MKLLYVLLELSPVIMAVIAILAAGFGYQHAKPGRERIFLLAAMITSALLILAQTALFISVFVTHEPPSSLNYALWAIFNNLTMLMILLYVVPRHTGSNELPPIQ